MLRHALRTSIVRQSTRRALKNPLPVCLLCRSAQERTRQLHTTAARLAGTGRARTEESEEALKRMHPTEDVTEEGPLVLDLELEPESNTEPVEQEGGTDGGAENGVSETEPPRVEEQDDAHIIDGFDVQKAFGAAKAKDSDFKIAVQKARKAYDLATSIRGKPAVDLETWTRNLLERQWPTLRVTLRLRKFIGEGRKYCPKCDMVITGTDHHEWCHPRTLDAFFQQYGESDPNRKSLISELTHGKRIYCPKCDLVVPRKKHGANCRSRDPDSLTEAAQSLEASKEVPQRAVNEKGMNQSASEEELAEGVLAESFDSAENTKSPDLHRSGRSGNGYSQAVSEKDVSSEAKAPSHDVAKKSSFDPEMQLQLVQALLESQRAHVLHYRQQEERLLDRLALITGITVGSSVGSGVKELTEPARITSPRQRDSHTEHRRRASGYFSDQSEEYGSSRRHGDKDSDRTGFKPHISRSFTDQRASSLFERTAYGSYGQSATKVPADENNSSLVNGEASQDLLAEFGDSASTKDESTATRSITPMIRRQFSDPKDSSSTSREDESTSVQRKSIASIRRTIQTKHLSDVKVSSETADAVESEDPVELDSEVDPTNAREDLPVVTRKKKNRSESEVDASSSSENGRHAKPQSDKKTADSEKNYFLGSLGNTLSDRATETKAESANKFPADLKESFIAKKPWKKRSEMIRPWDAPPTETPRKDLYNLGWYKNWSKPPEVRYIREIRFDQCTGKLEPDEVKLEAVTVSDQPPVSRLLHDLDRVLFNPGVTKLRDDRSGVYNFDPYLQSIVPVTEFDFDASGSYVPSSKDKRLHTLAKQLGKKYIGSTSSMSATLSHFHFLLSYWRPVNTEMLSKPFNDALRTFTAVNRAPSAHFLRYKDGVYAIDADKGYDSETVLSLLGQAMEKMLVLPAEKFEQYKRANSHTLKEEDKNQPDTYNFSVMGDFLMRSQLDAHDERLPGTGMFDLKTRACVAVRMDVQNFQLGAGYQIKHLNGNWESFEREYFDMIRAAFLKYSLQARIGRMDGMFICYHNTERVFGFQYIPLEDMDLAIHGTKQRVGDLEFKYSIQLWNEIMERATKRFPKQSLRIVYETRDGEEPYMDVFVEPMEEEYIEKLQTRQQSDLDSFMQTLKEKYQYARKQMAITGDQKLDALDEDKRSAEIAKRLEQLQEEEELQEARRREELEEEEDDEEASSDRDFAQIAESEEVDEEHGQATLADVEAAHILANFQEGKASGQTAEGEEEVSATAAPESDLHEGGETSNTEEVEAQAMSTIHAPPVMPEIPGDVVEEAVPTILLGPRRDGVESEDTESSVLVPKNAKALESNENVEEQVNPGSLPDSAYEAESLSAETEGVALEIGKEEDVVTTDEEAVEQVDPGSLPEEAEPTLSKIEDVSPENPLEEHNTAATAEEAIEEANEVALEEDQNADSQTEPSSKSDEPTPSSQGSEDGAEKGESSAEKVFHESHRNVGDMLEILKQAKNTGRAKTDPFTRIRLENKLLPPIFHARLHINNYVNGKLVHRPTHLKETDDWTVKYMLNVIESKETSWRRYLACLENRRRLMSESSGGSLENTQSSFYKELSKLSRRGRDEVREEMLRERGKEKTVWMSRKMKEIVESWRKEELPPALEKEVAEEV